MDNNVLMKKIEEDASALLVYLAPLAPSLSAACAHAPEALPELMLSISRVQLACAFEQPLDLEFFAPPIQALLDETPPLLAVIDHFVRHPALASVNPRLPAENLAAAEARCSEFLGSFLL